MVLNGKFVNVVNNSETTKFPHCTYFFNRLLCLKTQIIGRFCFQGLNQIVDLISYSKVMVSGIPRSTKCFPDITRICLADRKDAFLNPQPDMAIDTG